MKDNIQAILKAMSVGCANGAAFPNLILKNRVTAADINFGPVTLLAPVQNYKYQIFGMNLIAIGGAAGGSTSINIVGTRNGVAVNLLVALVAGLTQSTILNAGSANATILPDGASFLELDKSTGVTMQKIGANLTGATAIDVAMDVGCVKV
jgi:hypothetical protein